MSAPRILSAAEAVSTIPDGAALAIPGFGGAGVAQALCRALTDNHARTGHPTGLTLLHAAGHVEGVGIDWLASHGLVKRVIGGHWGATPNLRRAAAEGTLELHNWPQGIVVESFRAAAAGQDGLRTHIGLETFVDPRQLGGCLTESARKSGSLIRLLTETPGGDILHYPQLKPDFAFLRAWSADCHGNVSLGNESLHLCMEHVALATRNNGGRVVCQVREIEQRSFAANEVYIPGFLLDAVVVAENPEETHRHCTSSAFDPALLSSGSPRSTASPPLTDAARVWIGRRAAREVPDEALLNLGIGIPGDTVPHALKEAGRLSRITSTLESGVIGGVSAEGFDFGVAYGPQARISEAQMFDVYHGGNLDVTIMGMAETDAEGNVNVSHFAGRSVGCGGFIDITQSTKHVVFCSLFNGKGFHATFENGRLRIHAEGTQQKFVPRVSQITFNASRARRLGQKVLLVTERCVFTLGHRGWTLTEIAPGLDIEQDICARMGFQPDIPAPPQLMNASIFAPTL